ncbi:hypothetical protein AOQ71_18170 [Bradyrhizobium manausense]|uniref:Uncharacterized protein n=1 Tax=Bradyrhizobium manausense TaxID=989370 RepID=A0A0R3DND5_9BRAD|nr:hypothetical protein AOQ71_18170 [Bradyrhizobium manausense]
MLSLTGDVAARFEAGSDRSVGGGWAQHPVDRQGSRSPAADRQPWRHRYADHGLEGLQDKPRPGKQPIYTKACAFQTIVITNSRPS